MKKLFISMTMIVLAYTFSATWVEVPENSQEKLFEHVSGDRSAIEVKFSLNGYEMENVSERGETFQKITYFNEGEFLEIGKPDLPRFSRLIAIPDEGQVTIEILSFKEEILSDMNIYPQQELQLESEPPNTNFVIDERFYTSGDIFPGKKVETGTPAIMRDFRVVNVTVNPFQYDPQKNELRIIKKISFMVNCSGSGGENIKTADHKISRSFESFYASTILNYGSLITRDEEYQQPSYLFIYPNNAQVETWLDSLVNWKHRKGFEVTAANTSETGSSTSQIKNYIQDAYDNWDNPPEFVCLVGDAGGSFSIPTSGGDQYYTLLEGGDILADIFIGRLSFNSITEFQTIVFKILGYERNPYLDETDWYHNALLVGDPSLSGQSCVITKKNIKEMINYNEDGFTFDEVYGGSFVSQMSSSMNSGASYFNYRGYLGMSGWDNGDTSGLTNGYKLPVTVILTCGTGDFEGTNDCRSEYFLKAGTPTIPKGAIAAIGTATCGTHTCFNNSVDIGIYYGIFQDHIYHMGGALNRGKLNLYNNYPNQPGHVQNFSYWNNLMGDPGMEIWTNEPEQMMVSYTPTVSLGTNYLEVTVLNHSNHYPLENAWVTALKGEDEIFATGFTDSDGKIYLPIYTENLGNVKLTATKHNYVPHLGSFNIEQSDVFVNVNELNIDDDMSGTSSGNDDGIINPGEDIELGISLKNYGTTNANFVTASISSSSDFITITDGDEVYGTIEPGTSTYSEDDFDFSVDPATLGGSEIILDVLIIDENRTEWDDRIYLPVEGANLETREYFVIDANNAILDPGETAELEVTIENIGSVLCSDVNGTLSCNNEMLTIDDPDGYFGNIQPGTEVSNSGNRFEVTAHTNFLPGTQIILELQLYNAAGYDNTVSFMIDIGEVEITDPLGPDAYGYYCYDDGDTDYYNVPIYSWIEIDPTYSGSGTVLNMNDGGNTGAIQNVDIPFSFRFYGIDYTEITVCSNGWISPGTTEMYSFMNWHIPGPLGPSPMIAPFWDDLKTSGGHVCYYFDSNLHYFVVEWSHLQNEYNSVEETFQLILYDQNFYPTSTGDSEIVFQYKVVNNVDQGSYRTQHGQYATVGIEDHTSYIGLEYTYNNSYPTAAKPLQDEMAIFFTTNCSNIVDPPIIEINQEIFHFVVQPGETDSQTLLISNLGQANLIYNISKNYQESIEIAGNRDFGGPDNYGYQWIDSNEPDGPEYNWIDISALGTEVSFNHNDEGTDLMPIGFTYNYYGTDYNQFRINPNGWIGFGDDNTEWTNTAIPSSDAPRPAILPFWDDLNPLEGGNVLYYSTANSLVVWFDNVIHYVGDYNGTYDFEVIIYPDGHFMFQYRFVTGDIDTATIGIQNEDGTDGLQIVYNNDYVENELAIMFRKVIDWVDVEPVNGMIPAGETEEITISVETDELDLGEYLCNLLLYSNDPNSSLIEIPVNLFVMSINPEIDVSVSEINYGTQYIGESSLDSLTITNLGEDPLTVFDIYSDNDDFTVDITEFELATGQTQQVYVTFSPTSEGEIIGDLFILSNDPDESTFIINLTGTGEVLINSDELEIVFTTSIKQNYPNPFHPLKNGRNGRTTIHFSIAKESPVQIDIYNILGQKTKTIIKENLMPGNYQSVWDGTDHNNKTVASGIYFYRFSAGNYHEVKKMLIIK